MCPTGDRPIDQPANTRHEYDHRHTKITSAKATLVALLLTATAAAETTTNQRRCEGSGRNDDGAHRSLMMPFHHQGQH